MQNKIELMIPITGDFYKKDPLNTVLGNKILQYSIDLIAELGFEHFTFKKLANEIGSSEGSIYRYFESKTYLLGFLVNWYWAWQEYRLNYKMNNVIDSMERLKIALRILTEEIVEDQDFAIINEVKLSNIVINESSKVYMHKEVEVCNELGFYFQYKKVVQKVSELILNINPAYKYPHMLVSTVVEGVHYQRYFSSHLPRLTDVLPNEDAVSNFYLNLVINEITTQTKNHE